MATVSKLMVQIQADHSKLTRGLTQSENKVARFAQRAGKAIKVGFVAAVAVATASVVALGATLSGTSAQIDKIAKTSAKLGLSVEALQKLQFQAKLSGVSVETFNMAMQRMVRRVAEAAKGTGEAVGALQELGLDALTLNNLSPDEQFYAVSDAMASIGNQGDKVRLAMKLFDSEGVALVNTLGQNLSQTGEEFDRLGVSISGAQAAAVEAYNDAGTRLGAIWQGFKNNLMAEVAPAFQAVIDSISKTITEMGGVKVVAREVAQVVISSVLAIVKSFEKLGDVIDGVKNTYRALAVLGNKVNPFASKADVRAAEDKLIRGRGQARTSDNLQSLLNSLQTGVTPANARQQKPEVAIKVFYDENGVFNAVAADPQFAQTIKTEVSAATKDAARATRR